MLGKEVKHKWYGTKGKVVSKVEWLDGENEFGVVIKGEKKVTYYEEAVLTLVTKKRIRKPKAEVK